MITKNIYFTFSRSPAGLGDTLTSLDCIRSLMLQLPTPIPYSFKPLKFAHMSKEYWQVFYKYFGLSFHHPLASNLISCGYKVIPFNLAEYLSDFLKSDNKFNNFFGKMFDCYSNVILDINYKASITPLIDKVLLKAELLPRCQFTHYNSYFNKKSVLYREQLPHKSLFPEETKTKIFANYRMADFAVLKVNNDLWYDYMTKDFYNSLSEVKKIRKSTPFPVEFPDFFLPIFKKCLNKDPDAYILLTTDGYIEHPKLLDYFNGDNARLSNLLDKRLTEIFRPLKDYYSQLYIGRHPSKLFIVLKSLFDSDVVLKCAPQRSGFTNLKARCEQQIYNLQQMPYLNPNDSIYNEKK